MTETTDQVVERLALDLADEVLPGQILHTDAKFIRIKSVLREALRIGREQFREKAANVCEQEWQTCATDKRCHRADADAIRNLSTEE